MAMGEALIVFGAMIIIFSMIFRRYPRGTLRVGPFSGTGTIGFLIMILGAVVYLLEKGLLHL
jgi:hypothetical protein